jgi:hypothetical protein
MNEIIYKGNNNSTDCRDEHGITVGLIDSLIAISRVLSKRDFNNDAVKEALKDLAADEDIDTILNIAKNIK